MKIQAARTGRSDGSVIEEALRRDLGLDLLERLWEQSDLDESGAMELALEAQRKARGSKRR